MCISLQFSLLTFMDFLATSGQGLVRQELSRLLGCEANINISMNYQPDIPGKLIFYCLPNPLEDVRNVFFFFATILIPRNTKKEKSNTINNGLFSNYNLDSFLMAGVGDRETHK